MSLRTNTLAGSRVGQEGAGAGGRGRGEFEGLRPCKSKLKRNTDFVHTMIPNGLHYVPAENHPLKLVD